MSQRSSPEKSSTARYIAAVERLEEERLLTTDDENDEAFWADEFQRREEDTEVRWKRSIGRR